MNILDGTLILWGLTSLVVHPPANQSKILAGGEAILFDNMRSVSFKQRFTS